MRINKLDVAMREIAKLYFIALRNLNMRTLDSSDNTYSPFAKYYSDVEEAFHRLDDEKRRLITREYFYDGYHNWWIKEYKPFRFNHLKKLAIKEFVEAFYEIH